MSQYIQYPSSSGGKVPTYTSAAVLPSSANTDGDLAITLDTHDLYEWNGTSWVLLADPSVSPFAITALTSDVSATGPGSVAATVNSVGGKSAASISTSVTDTQAATSSNTPSTIVKRDGSGNFSAGTITASLTGHASLDVATSSLGNLTDVGTDGITVTGGTGAVVGSVSLSQHVSDATHNGYLNSTDWNTFNNKQSALTIGNITDVGTDGITITGGTGAIIGTGVSLSQHVSDTTHNGYLSSTDWNTFNSKQAALTFGNLTDVGTDGITITSGTGAIIGTGTSISQHVADTTHNGYLSSTDWNTFNGKVSTVSVASANGFAGSSSGGTTPSLTLSTSITGILQGNGTAISAASTTGSGNVVLSTNAVLTTPNLGTPSALVGTNITGTASGLTAGNVTTNANLTGVITSVGNTTSIASQTGTGTKFVVDTSPTLVTPNLGTPSAVILTSGTGLPLTSGVTGILPIANGGTNVSSVITSPTATSFAGWDANKNLSANNLIEGFRTQATANSTLALIISDTYQQYFTGTTAGQIVTLPTTGVVAGVQYVIVNNSSQSIAVQSSAGNAILTVGANNQGVFTSLVATPTTAANWSFTYSTANNASPPVGTVTSVTFTGDGTVLSSTPSSAVTSSGTLTASLNTQTARTFLTGPLSGSAAAPTFKALTPASVQVFTAGTTYTRPSSPAPLWLKITAVGAGGGGANGPGNVGAGGAGGGGGGGTSIAWISNPSSSYSFTIGAGGTGGASPTAGGSTTFNSTSAVAAGGGAGGVNSAAQGGNGGAGGAGSSGTINYTGGDGGCGQFGITGTTNGGGGDGGGSSVGGSGRGGPGGAATGNGNAGANYGAGGGGGSGAGTGGNGGGGIIIVEEFYQ